MEREQAIKFMHDLLARWSKQKASDLFITAGFPPAIKVDGKITRCRSSALTPQHTAELVRVDDERQAGGRVRGRKECNFAIAPGGHRPLPRERVRAAGPRRHGAAHDQPTIPTFEELGLPPVLQDICMTKRGLVIIVGATGSGKSTSLAAMVGYRNENSYGHIITIEDPVEFVHQHKNCVVTQREVGVDTDAGVCRAEEHPAPGARRDPDRRDPRPRDDGLRDRVRRDRPPVHGDAARQQRQPGARPHHQLLPRRSGAHSC